MHGGRVLERIAETFCLAMRGGLLLGITVGFVCAESNSKLTGRVIDPSDRPVPGVQILLRSSATIRLTVSVLLPP